MNHNGDTAPLAPSGDGRDPGSGRFLHGNRQGRGNPQARRVAALRATLLRAVTADELAQVVRALIDKAKGGDVAAIREVLDRCIGKVRPMPDEDTDRFGGLTMVVREAEPTVFEVRMPNARDRIN